MNSILRRAGSFVTLSGLLLAVVTAGMVGFLNLPQAAAQMEPIISPDPDCGESTAVDAAEAGSGDVWIAYDCSDTDDVRIVRSTDDASDSDSPQIIAEGSPGDVFVIGSPSGEAFVLAATEEEGHIVAGTCSSDGTCTTSPENPDNPTPPETEEEIELASGVDTSASDCGGEESPDPCTIDNDNEFDFCNDGCFDNAIVVDETPEEWDTISDTQWISGSPNASGFEEEPTNFFRTTFTLPDEFLNPSLTLDMLADGAGEVFLNGESIGSSEDPADTSSNFENPPTTIETDDETLFESGENTLTFTVSNEDGPMGLDYSGTVAYEESGIIIGSAPPSVLQTDPVQSVSFSQAGLQSAQITPVHVIPGFSGVQHPVGGFGSDETLYAAWENGEGDIEFSVSEDNGQHWSEPINLSDNSGESESPRLMSSGDDVYVTWEDDTEGNKEIYFSKSTDGGKHFNGGSDTDPAGDPENISSTPGSSINHEIALDGSNFYVVWEDQGTGNGDIYFIRSTDGGDDFSDIKRVESTNRASTEPDVAAKTIGGSKVVDLVWSQDSGQASKKKEATFSQSTDGGSTFLTRNVSNTKGESVKVLVSISRDNERYVAWLDSEAVRGGPSENYRIWATKSSDGLSFNKPQLYSEVEGKSLAAFVFDLADKVCAWDIHCSRCQGDYGGDGFGSFRYGTGNP